MIVEGVLDADLLARFNAELDPLLEQTRPDRRYLFFKLLASRGVGLAARLLLDLPDAGRLVVHDRFERLPPGSAGLTLILRPLTSFPFKALIA